jgi:multicomponent Na+:H+ antiporter subunit G
MALVGAALAAFGALFVLVATLGLLRFPDMFLRMHAVTKAGTLGAGLLMIAVALHFRDVSVATRALGVLVFVLLTAPVSAHMIGRAGYLAGVRLWERTALDELEGRYDLQSGKLLASNERDGHKGTSG